MDQSPGRPSGLCAVDSNVLRRFLRVQVAAPIYVRRTKTTNEPIRKFKLLQWRPSRHLLYQMLFIRIGQWLRCPIAVSGLIPSHDYTKTIQKISYRKVWLISSALLGRAYGQAPCRKIRL